MREAIRQSLPHYDPAIRQQHLAEHPPPPTSAPDDASHYGAKASDTVPHTHPVNADESDIVALPRIVVRPTASPPPATPAVQLPRLVVRPRPAGRDAEPDAFETPAARDEQLVKKHLSRFDRLFLNRFTLPLFGRSKEQRASDAEAVEQSARQLTEMAELIDLSQSAAAENESDADRQLRETYLDAFVSRPK